MKSVPDKCSVAVHVLIGTAISLLAIFELIIVVLWLLYGAQRSFNDFFGFWSFGRAAASGIDVYDISELRTFQNELTSAEHSWYPYFYPPSLLLPLIPLSAFPLRIAYIVWSVGGITAYIATTLGRRWRSTAGLSLLLAPTTLLTFIFGHSGLISSALLIGGLRQIEKRPILAGVLLGLLTAKPQNGLLVPVVLLAGRYWRVTGIASLVTLALVMSSGGVFGAAIWLDWLSAGPSNWRLFWVVFFGYAGHLMPTVAASMRQIGASSALADTAQVAVALGVFFITWRICKRGITERTIPAVLVGTILVTPYMYIVDLPLMTAAIVMAWQQRRDQGQNGTPLEVGVVMVTYVAILAMLSVRTAACRSSLAGTYVRTSINH